MQDWIPLREGYLDEILRLEGRRGYEFDACAACCTPNMPEGRLYRCLDCMAASPHCSSCLLSLHSGAGFRHALHRPEVHVCVIPINILTLTRTAVEWVVL